MIEKDEHGEESMKLLQRPTTTMDRIHLLHSHAMVQNSRAEYTARSRDDGQAHADNRVIEKIPKTILSAIRIT